MKRFVLYILLLLSLYGMTALSASAATYYVATTGVDTADGTQAAPWKTIQKAANTLVAGDTVYVRAGTYKEQVIPNNSGTSSGYITYSAYPGETVNVDGSNGFNGNTWAGIFDITSEDYIKIIGFHIVNSPAFGVHLYGANYIQILNNFTNNTSNSGIGTQESSNITIDGNDIGFMCLGADQNNEIQEGISLEHTPNSIVSNNKVHDGSMEGIDLKVGSSNSKIFGNEVYNMPRNFIYVDAWDTFTTNIEIYDNKVHDTVYKTTGVNAGSLGISIGSERGSTVSNINVYNNIIYNVSGDGIMLSDYHESGTPRPTFTNISIYNNTVYNTGTHVINTWGGSGINLSNDFQGSIHTGIIIGSVANIHKVQSRTYLRAQLSC
jgi:parallel beta-helix repeat protein